MLHHGQLIGKNIMDGYLMRIWKGMILMYMKACWHSEKTSAKCH